MQLFDILECNFVVFAKGPDEFFRFSCDDAIDGLSNSEVVWLLKAYRDRAWLHGSAMKQSLTNGVEQCKS